MTITRYETSEQAAAAASALYVQLLQEKPDAVLGMATGSTPLQLYRRLILLHQQGVINFLEATTFNLDEYIGLVPDHPCAYERFMRDNLFSSIDIPLSRTFFPTAETGLPEDYDEAISAAGGIDLLLLGIGTNGHIGFNEPGTPFDSLTHVAQLTAETRAANARFFDNPAAVPARAVTMGIGSILRAKRILLLATGEAKAPAIAALAGGIQALDNPASALWQHPDVTVMVDAEAASLLEQP